MKRRRSLSVVIALGTVASACRRQVPDPCQPATFNEGACMDAVQHQGYYSNGSFVPHVYPFPYGYYYGTFGSYRSSGGSVSSFSSGAYASPSGSSSSSVTRGGFGSTGSGGGSGE